MKIRRSRPAPKKAVVLLSGGLDSAATLYIAKGNGFDCTCLIFDYGQRHRREIESAKRIARKAGCPFWVLKISLPWKGSSLLDKSLKIPGRNNETAKQRINEIPDTYVPGRNIIFLSFALSFAESLGASAVFIGAHSQDYSGYPDCRPEFFRAFAQMAARGTRAGREKRKIEIKAPLLYKGKAEIIRMGIRLKVPFELTWSCYQGDSLPCEACDSCLYRAKGFREVRTKDPLLKR